MDLRVAAYAIITDEDGRILLAHWHEGHHSAWTLPGGGLEAGEDPEQAVRREIHEETGYRAEVERLLGIDSRVIPASQRISESDRALHTLRIIYRARVTGGSLRNEVGGSTDRAQWFRLAEVRSLPRVQLVGVGMKLAKLTF